MQIKVLFSSEVALSLKNYISSCKAGWTGWLIDHVKTLSVLKGHSVYQLKKYKEVSLVCSTAFSITKWPHFSSCFETVHPLTQLIFQSVRLHGVDLTLFSSCLEQSLLCLSGFTQYLEKMLSTTNLHNITLWRFWPGFITLFCSVSKSEMFSFTRLKLWICLLPVNHCANCQLRVSK